MYLHYRIVTLSAQIEIEGIYGYILVQRLHLYLFALVLALFIKVCCNFAPFSLFTLSMKCQLSTFEGHKAFSCKDTHPFNSWRLLATLLHSPWCHPKRQQALAPYIKEQKVQYYRGKGNQEIF